MSEKSHGDISIKTVLCRNMMLTALVSISLWSIVWIYFEYSSFKTDTEYTRNQYIRNQQINIRTEVNNLVEYIHTMRSQISNSRISSNDEERELLSRIAPLKFGKEDYFFGIRGNGEALFCNGRVADDAVKAMKMADSAIREVIEREIDVTRKSEGGFLEYKWKKPDSTIAAEKLSFVIRIPELNWIVGTGIYLDTVEEMISAKKEALKKELTNKLAVTIAILVSIFILIGYLADHMSDRLRGSISRLSSFFDKASRSRFVIPVDSRKIYFSELKEIAESANRMIIEKQRALDEKISLEQRLRQSHKMEAIGTLAGGIAHDINNILSVIIGNVELALYDTDHASAIARPLEAIKTASLNAKNIVRQLLSFSRKSDEEKSPVNLNEVVKESITLLRSSIPSSISIETSFEAEDQGIFIEANPTQIHQIMLNLSSNASHAMADKGGTLSISTRKIGNNGRQKVLLEIRDTGHGMEQDILKKIFDPYFTTKDTGKGTGMGLAVVHGIVTGHNGTISVSSLPGEGSTFEIIFTIMDNPPPIETVVSDREIPTGSGNILFVDDDEFLAEMEQDFLERLGYHVTICTSSLDALEQFRKKPDEFQLLITDMTMPSMNGEELIRNIHHIRPDIPVILCTGYHERINGSNAHEIGVTKYFEKPVDNSEFARAVCDVIECPGVSCAG